ncbi:MAG: GIY-YIG nuclease family protein [Terriglobia bacterium]
MYYVYVIRSDSGVVYIGQTEDIERRLAEHNSGKSLYTKRSKQWELIYQEECFTRSEAMKRERQLKSGRGREFIQSQIRMKLGS